MKIDINTSKEIQEENYIIKINYLTNKFKNISVNGKNNLTVGWEDPNGDKLLNDLISDCFENV